MCGIFGIIANKKIERSQLRHLACHARQRGRDSSGLAYYANEEYNIERADFDIKKLISRLAKIRSRTVLGHSRLITNGLQDNQPVVRDGIFALHNGIIVNEEEIWRGLPVARRYQIDSECIIAIAIDHLNKNRNLADVPEAVLGRCKGTVACALAFVSLGKLLLFSNNGSLYLGESESGKCFSSERYPLERIGCTKIIQICQKGAVLDIPRSEIINTSDNRSRTENLIPAFQNIAAEEAMLLFKKHRIKRCTRCLLTETMPYIAFGVDGVCNYCANYKPRNNPRPKAEIMTLVERYRRVSGPECIVPFSGGRDSCFGLHLIVKELRMRPITYTYDWGMVTDLGRRNISRMCAELGVENIIVADDISKKRRNIAMNLKAWLKAPDLGMVSILTAGDKHFFRHVETVKKQTGVALNLWGVNPLEVTHFKAGFLGVPPDFGERQVYINGISKQLIYQWHRIGAMLKSPGYFNRSLWDTVSGEYYRSYTEKKDYYHVFDYWRWEENEIDKTLQQYDWERALDTNTTWRIGDGTAAFYNYIYYTLAGFTEHDTFRSNQIREGQLTRSEALALVEDENRPRYQNIRWYLDAIGIDYSTVISAINAAPKLY